jgi:hypothetical protein
MIDLATCMTVKSAELKAHKRHALEVPNSIPSFDHVPIIIIILSSIVLAPEVLKAMKHDLINCSKNAQVSTPETTFLMFADSEKEKDDWIGAILFCVVACDASYLFKHSPSHFFLLASKYYIYICNVLFVLHRRHRTCDCALFVDLHERRRGGGRQ